MRLWPTLAVLALSWPPAARPARGEDAAPQRGTVHFEPGDQKDVPERYRLAPHRFDYEMTFKVALPASAIGHSLDAVRQTVLDLRRAAAWLEARPEVDRTRLGIVGTSLGSMVGALAAEMEPRLRRVVVLLGGGGLVDAYYDHPRVAL